MRIISPFKDYYDALQDFDSPVIYMREREVVPNRGDVVDLLRNPTGLKLQYCVPTFLEKTRVCPLGEERLIESAYRFRSLIFCGVMYRAIVYTWRYGNSLNEDRFYWTPEEFYKEHKFAEKRKKSRHKETCILPEEALVDRPSFQAVSACHTSGSPILCLHKNETRHVEVIKDVCLKDLRFYHRHDINATFQELSMFIGGVLAKREKIAPMTDKLKIQSHGMDETSFRRDPTKVHR